MEALMPAYPDRDTLRLRPVVQRSPADLADIVHRGMRHRLAPTFADVAVPATTRTLRSFRQLQPWAAERFTDAELRAVAKDPPAGCCWWGSARLDAKVHGERAPRWRDPYVRALLRQPCAGCRVILDPPKPKPKAKPAARKQAGSSMARSSTSTRTRRAGQVVRLDRRAAAERARVAAYVAGATPVLTSPERERYNRAAMRRLGMDPATAPHLTGAGR
jgi:hypothetical protein